MTYGVFGGTLYLTQLLSKCLHMLAAVKLQYKNDSISQLWFQDQSAA